MYLQFAGDEPFLHPPASHGEITFPEDFVMTGEVNAAIDEAYETKLY